MILGPRRPVPDFGQVRFPPRSGARPIHHTT